MVNLKIFSVAEYVEHLNDALFAYDAVVEGEIAEYKINQGKWIFFKLKDEGAVLECFSTVYKLKIPLEDGMRVRLYGRPGIYAKSGKFSMTVDWVEPAGEGALKRAYELLKQELAKEGLFAPERKRTLPEFPRRIGLVASRESAAYGDFVKVLRERFGGIEIYFHHTQVQGNDAVKSVVDAFSYFTEHQKKLSLDLLVLIRGGGSWEDLAAFNSREVAYAVFGAPVPVVCGVGHEQDETIADFVADVRASTPSNAAELIVPHRADVAERIAARARTMDTALSAALADAAAGVDARVAELDGMMHERSHRFHTLEQRLLFRLRFFSERIIMHQSNTDGFTRLIKSFSPMAVLERGYAIVRKNRTIIKSVRDVKPRDRIEMRLKDGEISAEVV
ncbi:MAG: exodeoxyribonuclease VII large subunit [Patescibacteria group bacterium]